MRFPEDYINRVIHGDCLEVMRGMPDGCVDAVVTDPPYAVPTVIAQGRAVHRNVGDLSIVETAMRVYFDEVSRIIRPEGRLFVCCDSTSYVVMFRTLYSRWATSLIVWDKGRIGMGREFRKSHELVVYGWRPSTPVFSDGKGRADVIRVDPVGDDRTHPAEKPVELIRQLCQIINGVIIDPFCGSGTTLVAAKMLGRRYIGIEIEKKYCDIAEERLRNTTPPLPFAKEKVEQGALL